LAVKTDGTVVAWGSDADGQRTVPAGLCEIVQVVPGLQHMVALAQDGTFHGWGLNAYGETELPAGIGPITQIDAGYRCTIALKADTTVVAWGTPDFGVPTVPAGLTGVTQVACGFYHTYALKNDGTLVGWGWNDYGQTNTPAGLADVSQVDAGAAFTAALREDGTVRAWGSNDLSETSVPADLNEVVQIAAGTSHTLARTTSGTVVAWGEYINGAINVPPGLTNVTQIAAGDGHSLALKADGSVVGWGSDLWGQGSTRPDLRRVTMIAAGSGTSWALGVSDCDGNEIDDRIDPLSRDLNGNGQYDSCDVLIGIEEDCDGNGIIDSWQQDLETRVAITTEQVGPIGYGRSQSVTLIAPPYAISDPVLTIDFRGDFGSAAEHLTLYMNGRYVGRLIDSTPLWPWYAPILDCQTVTTNLLGTIDGYNRIEIPREFFNEITWTPTGPLDVTLEFVPSIAVNANQCMGGSWVQATLSYAAAMSGDCNANGLLDVCEVRDWPETDLNGNGFVDVCEGFRGSPYCSADIDGSGGVDTGDISFLLLNFGSAMPGDPSDLDASGQVDNADISLLLLSFGDC